MVRRCACGAEIALPKGRGRPRSKCEACSPPRSKVTSTPGVVTPFVPRAVPSTPVAPAGGLEASVRATLEQADRIDTPDGAAALYAARMLDQDDHSGTSAATLLREMRSAVAAATKGAATGDDFVDELRERRRRRAI